MYTIELWWFDMYIPLGLTALQSEVIPSTLQNLILSVPSERFELYSSLNWTGSGFWTRNVFACVSKPSTYAPVCISLVPKRLGTYASKVASEIDCRRCDGAFTEMEGSTGTWLEPTGCGMWEFTGVESALLHIWLIKSACILPVTRILRSKSCLQLFFSYLILPIRHVWEWDYQLNSPAGFRCFWLVLDCTTSSIRHWGSPMKQLEQHWECRYRYVYVTLWKAHSVTPSVYKPKNWQG